MPVITSGVTRGCVATSNEPVDASGFAAGAGGWASAVRSASARLAKGAAAA
jgi:hypothetical protein